MTCAPALRRLLIGAWLASGTTARAERSAEDLQHPSACELVADLCHCVEKQAVRDLQEPAIGSIQLEDEKDRARDGQRAEDHRHGDDRIGTCKQAEAQKQDANPPDEHRQNRPGYPALELLEHEQACLHEAFPELHDAAPRRALVIGIRRKRLDLVDEAGHVLQVYGLNAFRRPDSFVRNGDGPAEIAA